MSSRWWEDEDGGVDVPVRTTTGERQSGEVLVRKGIEVAGVQRPRPNETWFLLSCRWRRDGADRARCRWWRMRMAGSTECRNPIRLAPHVRPPSPLPRRGTKICRPGAMLDISGSRGGRTVTAEIYGRDLGCEFAGDVDS